MSKVPTSIRNVLLSKHKLLGRKEYQLVKKRLLDDEYIKDSVYGSYQGGTGILVLTNKRVMIVDKRPFFDYIEQADYDSVSHLLYLNTSYGAALQIRLNKTYFKFRSFNEAKIRNMYGLIQFELEKGKNKKQQLPQFNTFPEKTKKVIRPLRRRARRHPAWRPHNPIMMGVITSSGIRISKD